MHSYFSISFNYTTIAWQIEHLISEIFIVDLLELVNKFPPFPIKLLDQFAAFLDSLNDQIMLSSKCNHGEWMNTALSLSLSLPLQSTLSLIMIITLPLRGQLRMGHACSHVGTSLLPLHQ